MDSYSYNEILYNQAQKLLVREDIFSSYKNKKRTELTKGNNIDYVTQNVRKIGKKVKKDFSEREIKEIKNKYTEFEQKYKSVC